MPDEVEQSLESQPIHFDDDEGIAAVEWTKLPLEREFFATPYDPPIKALIAELRENELIARPTFQRNAVWDRKRQSKFIESVLLNIPIPNLFFAEEDDGSKVVVDGQQRLIALKKFVENSFPLSGLEVLHQLNGKRFDDLTERQQRIISNRTLRCLVISAKSDSEIRFEVFERLNTGGLPLNAQEVRHCIFRGELNDLLHELSSNSLWLQVFGRDTVDPRMRDCELILRFFAIRASLPSYSPPLKKLLNDYMKDHRRPSPEQVVELRHSFLSTVEGVLTCFSDHPFRRATTPAAGSSTCWDNSFNRAVFDAQMLVMEGLDESWILTNAASVNDSFALLCIVDPKFSDSVSRATADKTRFEYRLAKWKQALLDLGAILPRSDFIPCATLDTSRAE
jgi:hypothetical protein